MINVQGDTVRVQTKTLSATLRRGALVSLRRKSDGREMLALSTSVPATSLFVMYRYVEAMEVSDQPWGSIEAKAVGDRRAEFFLQGWDAVGVIGIEEDPDTGDLIIEPAVTTTRPGVRTVRWTLHGLNDEYDVVAPLFQGVRMKPSDTLLHNFRWSWPHAWEAGLVILQHKLGGFWVHAQDTRYRYKILRVLDAQTLAFETEAYGPADENKSCGGVAWRINVYDGDWTVPAARYRDWLWSACNLAAPQARRPDWFHGIRLGMSWCRSDLAILEALSARLTEHGLKPAQVLIHLSHWRTDEYDQNYPTYEPSAQAKEFVKRARELGYHVMPHCNANDMDPTHETFPMMRDFVYRDVESKRVLGWAWIKETGRPTPVPEGPMAQLSNRSRNVMMKVHPALPVWRHVLGQNILSAARTLDLDSVFIDVTLCNYNLHNCLVNNTTPAEGMQALIDYVASLGRGLTVGGEGLNELTLGLSFAQAHLFKGGHMSLEELERTGVCDINRFLFGRLCRTIGYSRLDPEDGLRVLKVYANHGVIPTLIVDAKRLAQKDAVVDETLKLAAES